MSLSPAAVAVVWHSAMRKSALLGLVAAACTETTTGSGVGRPPATAVDRPEAAPPLRIAEIYVADTDPAAHFAELVVDGETSVALATAELCGFDACVAATCDDSVVAPGTRVVCDLGDLALTAAAGEVAVMVDDEALAYLAWGAAPSSFGSPWSAAALLTRALEPGGFVPLPYPMPSGVAVRNEPPDVGCAAPSPGAAGTAEPSLCPEPATSDLFITEILPAADDAAPSWIELESTSDEVIDLAWVRLCQIPSCVVFAPGNTIAPRSRMLVHLGRSGTDDASNRYFAGAAPARASGEVVLLAPGDADLASDSDSLRAYVRSGEGAASDVAGLAVDAGLWAEVIDSARAPRVAGESLSRNPGGEITAAVWNPAQPTPLAENPEISESTGLWESCSFPRPWQAQAPSALVVQRVSRGSPELIVLTNQGSAPIDLTTGSLELDGVARDLTDATPPGTATGPEDEAVIRIADTGVDEEDFVRGAATPGSASISGCDRVVISELVVDPQQDWSDTVAEPNAPFDATPGTGAVNTADQWVEIYNCTSETVDLRGYSLELRDSWSSEVDILDSTDPNLVGDLEVEPGGTLVVGNPDRRVGVDVDVEVVLRNAEAAVVDRVFVGVSTLEAGDTMAVELRNDSEACAPQRRLCWRDAPAIPSAGEINLLDGETLVDHFPWGDTTRIRSSEAVDAGIWPLATCALPELAAEEQLELVVGGTGQGVGDYELISEE